MTEVETVERCPTCDGRLSRVGSGPAWCTECEWNLGTFEPAHGQRPTRLLRRSHALAFKLNARVFDELLISRPLEPPRSSAELALTAVSLLLASAVTVLVAAGAYLIVGAALGWKLLGVLLLLIGVELRPRLPKLQEELGRTERADAPELFSVIDEVAARLGAPRIDVLFLDHSYNAWCGRYGIRRRCVLGLGLPLWGALDAQGRVAMLGHELGHLVNGDPGQRLVTQPAVTTFGRLATIFNPRALQRHRGGIEALANLLGHLVFTPLYWLFLWLHLLMYGVAARDHQRAEYYADALAVQLAGSEGAVRVMTCLVHTRSVLTALRRTGSSDPARWRDAAERAIAASPDGGALLEQYSIRTEAMLFASHPPSGMRRRLVAAWGAESQFSLAAERLERADAEIKEAYVRVARVLARTS